LSNFFLVNLDIVCNYWTINTSIAFWFGICLLRLATGKLLVGDLEVSLDILLLLLLRVRSLDKFSIEAIMKLVIRFRWG